MKLLLIAILMAILSISGFSQPETLFGSPEVTSAAGRNTTVSVDNTNTVRINQGGTVITSGSVNQGGTVTTSGYVKQGGTVETYGNVNQGGTVTTIGHVDQSGNVVVSGNVNVNHKWVNNPQPASTKTRTIYRTRNIVAPAPPVTVHNYIPLQEKLVAPVYNIYTTTPMDAGTAGKENIKMDPAIAMALVVILGLAVIGGIVAMIMGIINAFKAKEKEEQTKQEQAAAAQKLFDKVGGCTDGDMSGSVMPNYSSAQKTLRTVAAGTVPLATPVTPVINIVMPPNAWQGYINGQPNNQQHNAGQVQVQPGTTPISSITTNITYAPPKP